MWRSYWTNWRRVNGGEIETFEELSIKLEESEESVGLAHGTRPEVRASRRVKTVPASCTRPPVHLPSPARPVPAQRYSAPSRANRGGRCTGQAPCYAVECTVSPVRVLSPLRYIPAPHIWQARVKIQPGRMVPALLSRSPVRLHGPVHPVPPPRTRPPVAASRTRLSLRLIPTGATAFSALLEPSSSPAPPDSPICPELLESPAFPELLESPACPEPPVCKEMETWATAGSIPLFGSQRPGSLSPAEEFRSATGLPAHAGHRGGLSQERTSLL
uniref:pistil-specific extensin-like protein n=1 Tax=Oncorhynchus gorbuscha TaxID=8017 RepID=UPI001EAF5CC3|nr:pistil-specific extensin-like protein [Oncorhynchus gorbuscha]